MYKLVIVEDEEYIRRSLECYIPWKEMGFEVVSSFSDGLDAIEYIKENSCDAVLTDILMNKMSGLEMISKLNKISPEIKVVILSGHSDFSYAQQAIQYRVVDYLVKPVDEEDLIKVFKRIKEQLDREKAEENLMELENKELKRVLQRSFFRNLLSGHMSSEEELIVYLKILEIEESYKSGLLFSFEIRLQKQDEDEDISGVSCDDLERILKEQFATDEKNILVFVMEERSDKWMAVVLYLQQTENEEFRKSCNHKMLNFIRYLNVIYENCNFSKNLTHGLMKMNDLLNEINVNSKQSKQNSALTEVNLDETLYKNIISDYKLLVIELDLGNIMELRKVIDSLFRELKYTPVHDVIFIMKNLYSVIDMTYKKRKINVWDITNGKFDYNNLLTIETSEDIATCVKEDFCVLCEALKEVVRQSERGVIGRVTEYFEENIGKEVSHEVLAAKCHMHPAYLSRLFKQTAGETVSEYVFRKKMEKAAELLKNKHCKVGDVAAEIGYAGSSYFSVMFKRYTGYSPTEYRQRMLL